MSGSGTFAFTVHPRAHLGEDLARTWRPLGLLPDAFTMSELRHVYEAGIGRAFEPNNFRRIALGWGVLADSGERPTGGRPATLYRFAERSPLILAESARYRRAT